MVLIAICRASTVSRIRDLDVIAFVPVPVASAAASITASIILLLVIAEMVKTDAAQNKYAAPRVKDLHTHSLSRYLCG